MTTEFPIKTKFYMQAQDGEGSELCREHDLSETAKENAYHAAYEVKFDVLLHEDGKIIATHVNGVALESPIKL